MDRAEYFKELFRLCKDVSNINDEDIDPLINLSLPHLKRFAIVLKNPEDRNLFKEGFMITDEETILQFEERLADLIDDLEENANDGDNTDTNISENDDEENSPTSNIEDNDAVVSNVIPGANPVVLNGNDGIVGNVEDGEVLNNVGIENAEAPNNDDPIDHGNISDNEEPEETENPRSIPSTIVITDDDDNKTIDLLDSEDEAAVTPEVIEDRLPSSITAEEPHPSPSQERSLPSNNEEEEDVQNNPINGELSLQDEVSQASSPDKDDDDEFIPTSRKRPRIISSSESEDEYPRRRRRSSRLRSSSNERDLSLSRRRSRRAVSCSVERDNCSRKRYCEESLTKKPRQPNFPSTKGMPRELARLQLSFGAQEARGNKIQPFKKIDIKYRTPSPGFSSPRKISPRKTSPRKMSPRKASPRKWSAPSGFDQEEEESDKEDIDDENESSSSSTTSSIPFNKMVPIETFRFGSPDLTNKRKLYIKTNDSKCRVFWFDHDAKSSSSSNMDIYYCYGCAKYKITHAMISRTTTAAKVDPNHHEKCMLSKWKFS
uniref:Uncharacterized protein n=1 Tax=Panagrolaimus davidi TaxID=227884 RepID=A0A914P139_9BILA